MSRSLPEWLGLTPDSSVPPRVRLRVWDRAENPKTGKHHCQGPCHRELYASDKWIADHIVPLILGGENRESNLQVLCRWCSDTKTDIEVKAKAMTARKRRALLGIKYRSRHVLPGCKRSGWRHKVSGVWERRS